MNAPLAYSAMHELARTQVHEQVREQLRDLLNQTGHHLSEHQVELLELGKALEQRLLARTPTLPVPNIYPTPDHSVSLEWLLEGWAVAVEVGLPRMVARLQARKVGTGAERRQLLLLANADDSDWEWLCQLLLDLQGPVL